MQGWGNGFGKLQLITTAKSELETGGLIKGKELFFIKKQTRNYMTKYLGKISIDIPKEYDIE